MERMVEGKHTGFMRKITVKREQWKADGTRVIPMAEVVKEAAVIQS